MFKSVKLSDVVLRLETGGRPRGGSVDEGIPSLGAEHLGDMGGFNLKSMKYVPVEYFKQMRRGKISTDEILVVKDGATTGKVAFVSSDFPFREAAVNEHVFKLTIDKRVALPKFTYYFLFSSRGKSEILKDFRGATVGGITRGFQELVSFPLPPIQIQNRVVLVLDKAQELIDKRKQQIEMLAEFLQSVFLDMFGDLRSNPKGWRECFLGEIIIGTPQNGLYKPASEYTSDGSGTPILRIDSFYGGEMIDFTGLKRLNCSDVEIQKYKLSRGNIVINRVNSIEYLGKCGLVTNLLEETVFESNMMRIHLDERTINPIFLSAFLSSKYVYSQILGCAKKAVNQASINQKDVSSFRILVPPIEIQKKYAELVNVTVDYRLEMNRGLVHLQNLFNSIMQRAFKGELFS